MKARYINANAVLPWYMEAFPDFDPRAVRFSMLDIDSNLNNIPTARVGPVMTGHWIGGELGYCSCCGHKGCASDIWNGVNGALFCPACGAELEETP